MQDPIRPITNLESAASLAGVTALVYGIVQYAVKPALRVKYGVEGNEKDDDKKLIVWKYRREMNMWAIGLGVVFGVIITLILGYAAASHDVNLVIAIVAQGALTGFWGGGQAIALHEMATNINRAS